MWTYRELSRNMGLTFGENAFKSSAVEEQNVGLLMPPYLLAPVTMPPRLNRRAERVRLTRNILMQLLSKKLRSHYDAEEFTSIYLLELLFPPNILHHSSFIHTGVSPRHPRYVIRPVLSLQGCTFLKFKRRNKNERGIDPGRSESFSVKVTHPSALPLSSPPFDLKRIYTSIS
jgi:hypothetical protein